MYQPALISEGEREWIVGGAHEQLRNDGRQCQQHRELYLEYGSIATASGSARLRLGGSDIIVGVKAEIGVPEADKPDCGRIQFSVDVSPCAGMSYQGRVREEWSAELTNAVERSYRAGPSGRGGGIDLSALCIISGKTCWIIYVDAIVVNVDANALDAISIAIRAALFDTRIPKVEVTPAEDSDDEPELELDDDPETAARLDVSKVPVIVTVAQIGHACVVDLTKEEDACAAGCLQVAVTADGTLFGATKRGPKAINPTTVLQMIEIARRLGPEVIQGMDGFAALPAAVS